MVVEGEELVAVLTKEEAHQMPNLYLPQFVLTTRLIHFEDDEMMRRVAKF